MTVLEKIKRCVSLVWDFQEFYGDEDIEDFCSNELYTYSQYNEILDYFKRIAELEAQIEKMKCCIVSCCEGCERLPKLYEAFDKEIKEKWQKLNLNIKA